MHFSEEVAALTAGGMCLIGISIVWLFVPKSTKRAAEKEKVAKGVFSIVYMEGGREGYGVTMEGGGGEKCGDWG